MPRGVRAAVGVSGALLILLATVFLIRAGIMDSRARSAYRFALRDAVYALEQGQTARAADLLRDASRNARSPEAWLRLLKQARRLPEDPIYPQLLEEAHTAFPGDPSISALRGYELLTDGEPSAAWQLLSRRVDPDAYPALLSAALLSAGATPEGLDSPELELFASLPEAQTPEPFLRAYEFSRALPFLDNALLLTLERGAFEQAEEILERYLRESEPGRLGEERSRLLLVASHTLENRSAFYTYLEALGGASATLPEPLLLQADLRMSAREWEEAALLYEEVRTVAPRFSPVVYLNGALLLRREGRSAVELLERGAARFPEELRVRRALLRELIATGREEEASSLLAEGEPDMMSALLEVAFFRPPSRDRGYVPRLWRLLNDWDNPPEAARLLAYHLVGTGDLEELERLIDRFPPETHGWSRFYTAYLAYRTGRYAEADTLFEEADLERYPVPPWMWEGNSAFAALRSGSYSRAVERARQAREQLLAAGQEGSAAHGTLLTLEAEALRLAGRRQEALTVARRAVEIAPESSSARLVLRNLEGLR